METRYKVGDLVYFERENRYGIITEYVDNAPYVFKGEKYKIHWFSTMKGNNRVYDMSFWELRIFKTISS